MDLIKAIIVPLLLLSLTASGQTSKIDSLKRCLENSVKADIIRVNLLNTIAFELFSRDAQKANVYAQQAGDISSKLNYSEGRAASLWVTGLTLMRSDKKEALRLFSEALKIAEMVDDKVGVCNYLTAIGNTTRDLGDIDVSNEAHERSLKTALEINNKPLIIKAKFNIARNKTACGNPLEAAQHLQEALKIAEEINDEQMLPAIYGSLGTIHQTQGNCPAALEYYLSALVINEKQTDYARVISNLVNIAGIQSDQNNFDVALETINKALQLSTEKRDSVCMSLCLVNIGNIYDRMKHPKALDYFQKALAISKTGNIGRTINALTNVGAIYTANREFDKAAESLGEALALAQKAGMKKGENEVYIKMGILYLEQKQYAEARSYIQKALVLSEKIHFTEVQKDCHRLLSEIYAATGNFQAAYTSYTQYKLLFDSLFNEKNTRKIALLESSYQFSKEREVYELEKSGRELRIENQQQTILLLVIISLLVLGLSLAIYWSGRLKKRALRLEIEHINQEFEANQKAMAVAKLKLVQNSERDAQTIKKLEDIGKCAIGIEHKSISTLISDYKFQSNHSNWTEFEILFTKVNTSFWDKLNELYSDLTPNERKLCVFLKLNMNNKDIALITLQSEEALKKSRLRLRKKFDLDRSANLSAFIQNL